MRKILGLTIAALLVIGLAGVGTWAYFSDVETSSGNELVAGTLDLTPDTPGAFITSLTDLVPEADNAEQQIEVTNAGSIDASSMDIDITITATDVDDTPLSPDGTGTAMTPAEFAEALKVETLTWLGGDLLSGISENGTDGNNYIDLAEVASADLTSQTGLDAGSPGTLAIDFTLDPNDDYGNDPQGDGCEIEVEFTLNQ
jgi:predicted ribosomally synthesized peptide with SipW-like signal peptide